MWKPGVSTKLIFDALPLGKGDGVLHGYAAGDFFFVIGGDGRAIGDAALGWGHFGGMQQSGNQGGFAAVRMPHYSYVADLTSLVRFHGFLLDDASFGWRDAGMADPQVRVSARLGQAFDCAAPAQDGMGEGTGTAGDVLEGVQVAGLEGHSVPVCRLPRP